MDLALFFLSCLLSGEAHAHRPGQRIERHLGRGPAPVGVGRGTVDEVPCAGVMEVDSSEARKQTGREISSTSAARPRGMRFSPDRSLG